MCIVIAGESEPDTTKLIHIPIIIDNNKYNFFMYINNFDINKNSVVNQLGFNNDDKQYSRNNFNFTDRFNESINLINNNQFSNRSFFQMNDNGYGNYASFDTDTYSYTDSDRNTNKYYNTNSVMVVPFPVNPNTLSCNIGLVDISTEDMKKLRKEIISLKPYLTNSFGSVKNYSHTDSLKPLEVHKIGNYNISIATSYNQLLERIDWTKFNKPDNFEKRMGTFRNTSLYPQKYAYFYVIASAIENIKDDGFGIVYPQLNDNLIYLPTAHEDTKNEYNFDVEMYVFGYNKSSYTKKDFHNILNKLQNKPVKMLNNVYKNMTFDTNISSFNFIQEKSKLKNHNIFWGRI